jgi:hypothetical protein
MGFAITGVNGPTHANDPRRVETLIARTAKRHSRQPNPETFVVARLVVTPIAGTL